MKKFSEVAKSFVEFEERAKKLLEEHTKQTSNLIAKSEKSLEELEKVSDSIKEETRKEIMELKNKAIEQIKIKYEEKKKEESRKIVEQGQKNFDKAVEKIVKEFIGEL